MELIDLVGWLKVDDIDTLSLMLLLGMFALLAIGMPLGFASAFLAVITLMMKLDADLLFRDFGRGPFSVLGQAVYRQMTNYVLISVPLFIFMASLLERSGIARDMYSSLNLWLSRMRGGIVIGVVLGSIYGGITGITEAAGMGVVAVFLIRLARREMTFEIVWDSLIRTLKSTGTIIWVTIGAAALAAG